jgi:membrane protease YdiL (CAAX protease family)
VRPSLFFTRRHPVLAYYGLTFGISWGGGLLVLGPDEILGVRQPSQTQFLAAILTGIAGPSLAGILMTSLMAGRTGLHELRTRLFNWRVGIRWYVMAALSGPLLASAVLLSLSVHDPVYRPGILGSDHKLSLILTGIAVGAVTGFFEELGWTGFAIPRLRERHSILTTGLLVGSLWGAWHLLLFSGQAPHSGLPAVVYLPVLLFSFLPPFRVLMIWLYDRTSSLLVVMIMHAGLSASSLILTPKLPGVAVIIYDLVFAATLWLLVGLLTWTARGNSNPAPHPPALPPNTRLELTRPQAARPPRDIFSSDARAPR